MSQQSVGFKDYLVLGTNIRYKAIQILESTIEEIQTVAPGYAVNSLNVGAWLVVAPENKVVILTTQDFEKRFELAPPFIETIEDGIQVIGMFAKQLPDHYQKLVDTGVLAFGMTDAALMDALADVLVNADSHPDTMLNIAAIALAIKAFGEFTPGSLIAAHEEGKDDAPTV